DGELQEGQVWEAALAASHYKLDNLVVIVDNNNLQIDGEIASVINIYPIADKFKAFGFNTVEIDGHNIDEISESFKTAKTTKGMPTCIIAKTAKGKGVSFMENQAGWHGQAPNAELYEKAQKEITDKLLSLGGQI
ncbi:MAG: transketolase, partial [Defluviitaleaceae bacterium]|nr:transketolase [Defluviitaleaceae bacterium]